MRVKPFLRWAGGKQWISRRIAKLIPADIGTYFEPFLGGGSLYFSASPTRAILSDVNLRLIEAYKALRDQPIEVISILKKWRNDKCTYYVVRDKDFGDLTSRAAQLIYLNRTCWNGLFRVNRRGKFNVPFGNHGRAVYSARHLLDVSRSLQGAKLRHGDFELTMNQAKQGDFVYLDPPYTSLHQKNSFRQYNEHLFNWNDQERLAHSALKLAELGCHVLVSNADHHSIVDLYPGFSVQKLERHSVLAASARFRRVTTELLIASDPNMLPRMPATTRV